MTVHTLSSADGTTIAYDEQGEGPALILVDGALTVHSSGSGAELAKLLAPHFTVYGFDRRGRGGSGDTPPYAVDREIDDIEALADRAGGPAFLYGHSSGGPLAMRAAIRLGGKVAKIAMYEPPYNNDPGAQESWSQYLRRLNEALAEGRRGDAGLAFLPGAARALSQAIPQGRLRTLEGQPHEVSPGVLAPVLVEFFTS
jgi:pimeloyl-ACP methyl ester carboxylesterase